LKPRRKSNRKAKAKEGKPGRDGREGGPLGSEDRELARSDLNATRRACKVHVKLLR